MAKLLLFTGKGGVGKSSISASSALYWADKGYKTLLVSSDPAHSTEDVVGQPIGTEPTYINSNFWAMNINSHQEGINFLLKLQEYFDNTVAKWYPGFDSEILTDWASFPGMDEIFALEKLVYFVQGIEYDLIVFDTAPTGHTLKALTTPDSLNKFLIRILRMKSKMEGLKNLFFKKNDSDKMVKYLQETIDRIERIKNLLRDNFFVSMNLVSIPTEAGFQECRKTLSFLQGQGYEVDNIIINQMIPSFEEEVWSMAHTNKAVGLLKKEFDNQQPYLEKFKNMSEEKKVHVVGVSRVPFEPRGEFLKDFHTFIWRDGGVKFTLEKTITIEDNKDIVRYRLLFPNSPIAKLNKTHYQIDNYKYNLPPIPDSLRLVRKTSKLTGAIYSFKKQ